MKKCSSSIGIQVSLSIVLIALSLSFSAFASSTKAKLDVQLSTPVVLESHSQTAFLKVGLTGFPLEGTEYRTPVNVAIVIDRSGSMAGEKMQRAKEAAIMAIERLSPDDIVSVVSYGSTVEVIVPATKVDEKNLIYRAINRLYPSGSTALFAGVSKGARQVRKFSDTDRVNRIILVSDGLANVGPSSPQELGSLGRSLAKEGVSVTTIGLGNGYNEDLMVALAGNSDGNHAFVENASDLAQVFAYEFGDLLSVVARNISFKIKFNKGIRPVRVLGRFARIHGRQVSSNLTQLYANQEKFLLIEMQITPNKTNAANEVASVDIQYSNTVAKSIDVLSKNVYVSFTDSWTQVEEHRNDEVMVTSVELIAAESQKTAIALRDKGNMVEAKRALENNAAYLESASKKYKSKRLKKQAAGNRKAKSNLAPSKWKRQRKAMYDDNYAIENQQMW